VAGYVFCDLSCDQARIFIFTIGFELVKALSLHHLTSDFAPSKKPATYLHNANQGMKWYQIIVINKPQSTSRKSSQDRSNRAATAASTTHLAGHLTRLLRGGLTAR
jgi:hypothetical protein